MPGCALTSFLPRYPNIGRMGCLLSKIIHLPNLRAGPGAVINHGSFFLRIATGNRRLNRLGDTVGLIYGPFGVAGLYGVADGIYLRRESSGVKGSIGFGA